MERIITRGKYRVVYKWMPSINAFMIDTQLKAPDHLVIRKDRNVNDDGYLSCRTVFASNENEAKAALQEAIDHICDTKPTILPGGYEGRKVWLKSL